LPAADKILMLSGRISFELVQKAVRARIPIIAAVGAPSSLSIDLAKEYGVTLIGFLKAEGFNIYTGFQRIIE
jgi:FdhD protein